MQWGLTCNSIEAWSTFIAQLRSRTSCAPLVAQLESALDRATSAPPPPAPGASPPARTKRPRQIRPASRLPIFDTRAANAAAAAVRAGTIASILEYIDAPPRRAPAAHAAHAPSIAAGHAPTLTHSPVLARPRHVPVQSPSPGLAHSPTAAAQSAAATAAAAAPPSSEPCQMLLMLAAAGAREELEHTQRGRCANGANPLDTLSAAALAHGGPA